MTEISLDELLAARDEVTLLDVRSRAEFDGEAGYPCDPRQGHIEGARSVPLDQLLAAGDAARIRALVGAPAGATVVAYCHVGQRSELAAQLLSAAGYDARNYAGSWHEWARRLPAG